MPKTEAQKRAQAKYREKTYELRVALFPPDKDIFVRLEEIDALGEARAAYIKRLIREDIEHEKNSKKN